MGRTENRMVQYKKIQINLQRIMDQRLYHYQYRRPRLNNPTYSSFNVNNSMTFFMNSPSNGNNYNRQSSYEEAYMKPNPNSSQYINSNSTRYAGSTPRDTPPQVQTPPTQRQHRQRAQSNLSSYGNNSLAFNQREIYNKQNSKFNIISLKPKEVPDQIKQYPKFTLENKDDFYYKKMQQMRDYELTHSAVRNSSVPAHNEGVVAGKHTFAPEEGKNPNYYQYGRYFTPKMLNHADQVSHIM